MHSFWSFFINNDRFSYLLMVALLAFGVLSIILIPKESAPEVEIPVGIVTTVLPGAPAADVESLVTNELERGLIGALSDVRKITSVSRESVSVITVEFEADADLNESISDLKDEIDLLTSELPENAEDPRVTRVDFVNQPITTFAVSGDVNDRTFTELADALEADLEQIPGISRVETAGVQSRQVTVIVDQAALARFNLSLNEVVQGLRAANTTFPIGQIINDGTLYNVAFEGDITNTAQIENVSVANRGGQPVYVRDIAFVDDGLTDATTLARLSVAGAPSERSISFNVFKQTGGDITRLSAAVRERLDELQVDGALLAEYTVETTLDSGEQIGDDLVQLTTSGLQTVTLVILLLVVAIGWREGLIAGISIPLSFMIGFIGLFLSGNTINFISLFALILGIGILVDSGIVIVEGINRRMKDNPMIDKIEAARLTVREFATPLMAGTLTTVAMFVGLFIVSGVTGQFIASIPFTLIFVMFASLLVALGFLPLIASSVLRRRSATRLEQKQIEYARQLEQWYRRNVGQIIGNRWRERAFLLSIGVGFVVAMLLPVFGLVQVIFFAPGDSEWVFVEVELPEGTVKEETDIVVRQVEEVLYQKPHIESFLTTIGQSSAFGGSGGSANEKLANIFITLREDRDVTSLVAMEQLRAEFANIRGANITVNQPDSGPPTGAPIGIRFTGEDLTELSNIAIATGEILKTIPNVTNVQTSSDNNSTEFVLNYDRARAAALGVDPQSLSLVLRTAVFGTDATSITTLDDDIDVVVKLDLTGLGVETAVGTNRATIDALNQITIATPRGDTIPVGSLVDVSLRESSAAIAHEDGLRVVSVSADLTSGGNVLEVNRELVNRIESELNLPAGILYTIGGETEESNQAFAEMGLALIVGVVLMLAILVLQFNSFRYPLYVLSILPFSLIGIMFGLALTGNALSFPSVMGFIALSGIVVNNSILLIDMMNQQRMTNPQKAIRDVVLDAASNRLRPILLTTLTTVIGMMPLLFIDPLWVPLATAIMFGLVFSVIITLILIPVIYNRWPGKVR